ncbi:unnamed protein product [Spodoptera littoralis]|uniref:Uncharacterized protein n=1 Tax=Spodoptera littoralis TaxID=7109 RepID=A0A9P0HW87_SPOLI|nr:unnamed protein product [Spodoptera littoralis]CAH1636536.1 unnamed protein product [Spodoptera littoralis]
MFFKRIPVLFMFVFFVFCDAGFVDNLPKCHLKDNECLRDLYETVIRDIGKHGIPDLNIPPVDPIRLTNVTVSVLNVVNITMVEGVAKGIKDCLFEKFSINITSEIGHQENTCDLTIKGHYKVDTASSLAENLLGGMSVHGDGNGKVKIDKLHLKFDFPFYAQRRDDGEIYIKCIYDLIKYDYEFGGKVAFFADNLYVGEQEISSPIIAMLNENWRFVMSGFGQPFVDKAMEFYFRFAGYFFDNVPARYYIIDDLSPYAKP